MIRWGIAGTGRIASDFAKALARVPDGQLAAVASRSPERAEAFAARAGARHAHGSLAGMLEDPTVDVVYVASPHSEHCPQTVAALDAGKHVLVEKPFAMSADQARRMTDAAERNGRFLMEALWSRFLPAYTRLRELVDEGVLGDLRSVHATFGIVAPPDSGVRLLNPELGGGALLDLGIYPIHLAQWLLGEPDTVCASAGLGPTGVDLDTAVALGWGAGQVATAQASLSTWLPMTGVVAGTRAWVELPLPHHHPESLTVHRHGTMATPSTCVVEQWPVGGDGLRYEIEHVHACLQSGAGQSDVMPLCDSLALMRTMDRVREAIDLDYPSAGDP